MDDRGVNSRWGAIGEGQAATGEYEMANDILQIGVNGERVRIRAAEGSVVGTQEVARLLGLAALPMQLLQQALNEGAAAGEEGEATVCVQVPTNVDGMLDLPRPIEIQTAILPRDLFDGPPGWFVGAIQQAFDDGTWEDLDIPPSREVLLAFHSPEFVKKHKDTNTEGLFEMSRAPYCTQLEEEAIRTFIGLVCTNRLFDHTGWVETEGQDVLVSEPYGGSMADFHNLKTICDDFGWEFKVLGVSGHFPSATIRIEIRPTTREGQHAA